MNDRPLYRNSSDNSFSVRTAEGRDVALHVALAVPEGYRASNIHLVPHHAKQENEKGFVCVRFELSRQPGLTEEIGKVVEELQGGGWSVESITLGQNQLRRLATEIHRASANRDPLGHLDILRELRDATTRNTLHGIELLQSLEDTHLSYEVSRAETED